LDLQKQASKYYWYHSVDLGNGVIIDGDYDIREVLLHCGFPERMDGMDVLDVGCGSGFFAFEFERRRCRDCDGDLLLPRLGLRGWR
jgi:ubiquinone/menaquinone biosynthesis C-methylase UbiE